MYHNIYKQPMNLPVPIQDKLNNLANACDQLSAAIKTPVANVAAQPEAQVPVEDAGAAQDQVPEAVVPAAGEGAEAAQPEAQVPVKEAAQVPVEEAAQVPVEEAGAAQPVPVEEAAQDQVPDAAQDQVPVEDEGEAQDQVPVEDAGAAQVPVAAQDQVPDAAQDQVPDAAGQGDQEAAGSAQGAAGSAPDATAQVPDAAQGPALGDNTAIQVDGSTLLYGNIIKAFENMQTDQKKNVNKLSQDKLDEVYNKLKTAKTTVEVQNILRAHNFEMGGTTPAKRFVKRVIGGTRKPRMHRRKKTQRKRSKTIKKKNRAGNRR